MHGLASVEEEWETCSVQRLIAIMALAALGLSLSSCFLVSVPVKATGEIIEKSAYATGEAATGGIRRVTTPDGENRSNAYGASQPPPAPEYYPPDNSGYYDANGDPIEQGDRIE